MGDGFAVVPSANFDDRPPGVKVDCIILHATVLDARESLEHLTKPRFNVSSHYLVDRNGFVLQLVPPEKRAWHAGSSRFRGRDHVNDFSVGIEMVNKNDGIEPFTEKQYTAVAHIIGVLRKKHGYAVPNDRIVSHAAIAVPKGRKSDPRGFSFTHLFHLLAHRK